MTLFKKGIKVNVLPRLTKEKAQEIYEGLKLKDINRLFLEDNIPTEYSVRVQKEANRLECEMVSKMNGSFIIVNAVLAIYNKGGEVIEKAIPAVFYKVTTELSLKNSMSSELLDVNKLVVDVRAWSEGNPNEKPSWKDYKSSFIGGYNDKI